MTGLHASAEHFDGTNDDGGKHSGTRTSKEGSIVVGYAVLHGTVRVCAQPIVTSKIDDVGRDGHEQSGAQAAPESCKAFIPRNLLQAIDCGVESSSLSLLCRTLRNKHFVDSKTSGRGNAVWALVGDVVDLSTACRDTEIGREARKGGLGRSIEGRRTRLSLQSNAHNVEGCD